MNSPRTEASGQGILSEYLVVAALAVVAMAVRMLFFSQWAATPLFMAPMGDEGNFHRTALALIGQSPDSAPGSFLYQPLYSFFLALLYLPAPGNLLVVKTIQLFIGVGSVLLFYGLGRELGGRGTGRAAAFFAALYGPQVFFEGQLLAPVLTVPLLTGALWSLLVARRRKISWPAGLGGLLTGLATMGRPNLAVVLPVFFGFLLWGRRPRRAGVPALSFCLLGVVVGLSPSWIHNLQASQGQVPVSASGGHSFYLGNNPKATGAFHIPPQAGLDASSHSAYRESLTRVAQREKGRELTPAGVSSYWYRRGFSWMIENPVAALGLFGRKLLLALNDQETPIHHPYLLGREVAPVLSWLFRFSVVFPFAMLGIVLGLLERKPVGLLLASAVFYLGSLVAFYVADRYRILLMPMLIPLAGLGVVALYRRLRDRPPRAWWLPAVILAAAFGLTRIPLENPSSRARALSGGYNLMGKAQAESGNLVEAEKYFQKAIRVAGPGRGAVPRANLGLLLERRGDLDGARKLYLQSAAADPRYRFCRIRLALMAERQGDLEGALHYWKELSRLDADPQKYQKPIRRLKSLLEGSGL